MAIYDNLPVFKDIYDLLLQTIRLSMNLQRDFHYTIGERLKTEIMDLCIFIYNANGSYEKQEFIEKARERMVVVKLQVRVLHDMKHNTGGCSFCLPAAGNRNSGSGSSDGQNRIDLSTAYV